MEPGPRTDAADYRAFIFVNGWLTGQYDIAQGPQHQFFVPAGILNPDGDNTLAIPVWGLDSTGGGLPKVSLVAFGDQSGGVPVQTVDRAGYNPFVSGGPTSPVAILGLTQFGDACHPGSVVHGQGRSHRFTWPNGRRPSRTTRSRRARSSASPGRAPSWGFLAAANNSAQSGTGTVYHTDGTTFTFTLDVSNLWYPSGQNGNPSNTQVPSVNYANYPTGSSGHTIYVFEQSVPIDAGKTVKAVALPPLGSAAGRNPTLHIYAIDVGS
ncbi:MAG: beta galactosidase jelly roll domain-containing protein [Solirubrobacteraceae bacterium]